MNQLFLVKAHYFLYFGGAASFWSFVTVFGKQIGISEIGIGLIFIVAPITGLVSMPLFGAIADRFNIQKKLFLLFNLLNTFAFLSFAFLPAQTPTRPVSANCLLGSSYLTQCGVDNEVCNQSVILTTFWNTENMARESVFQTECNLRCQMSSFVKSKFCENLLDKRPDVCDSANDQILDLNIHMKISEITFVGDCLVMPIDTTSKNVTADSGYLCAGKTDFQNTSCSVDCPQNKNLNTHLERLLPKSNFIQENIFWVYGAMVLVAWICMAVVTSVADALCFQTLGDKPHLYGKQRQWGAIGWGLFSLLSGYLIDLTSKDGGLMKDYTPAFCIMAVLLLLNLIVCYKWEVQKQGKAKTLGKDIVELITNPTIAVFIGACAAVGMCTGVLWQFLFWYVEDLASTYNISCDESNLKYVKSLQGLISVVQCFGGELPFFYISGWFIKRLGHVHCMSLVLGAFGVRFLLYSILVNPWTVLPVELFQGLTYGIFYSNMASYAYTVSPPGTAATVQGIVGGAFEGIGVGSGSLLGGILYKVVSGKLAFRIFGFATLGACLLHITVMYFIERSSESKQSKEINKECQEMLTINEPIAKNTKDAENY